MDDARIWWKPHIWPRACLEVREYFTADNPWESDVRNLADRLWRDID